MPESPRLILSVSGADGTAVRHVMAAGETRTLGRTSLADLVLAGDDHISQLHCTVQWDGTEVSLQEQGQTGGTFLGGQKVKRGSGRPDLWLRLGHTDVMLYAEDLSPPPEVSPALADRFAEDQAAGRLFALLDAARSDWIVRALHTAVDPSRSLFQGTTAITMADAAPYLVHLTGPHLWRRILARGWGESALCFVVSTHNLEALRSHFRRLLYVERVEQASQMYFRFYDPRVLRHFLPKATPRQRAELFGPDEGAGRPVSHFVVEGSTPETLVRLTPDATEPEERRWS